MFFLLPLEENIYNLHKKYHEILFVHRVEFIDENDRNLTDTLKNIEGGKDSTVQYEWIDLDDIDKMEWKVDEEDGSEYIKIDEINKSVYVALGDNGYYTFLYDGNSNSITPLDDYVDSEEDAKASAKEFLKDYVEGFY